MINKLFKEEGKGSAAGVRGATALGCLGLILLVVVLGYGGYKVGEAYWTYYKVREKIRESLIWAAAGNPKYETTIILKAIEKADEAGVRLHPRNFKVTQTADTLTITAVWTHELKFPRFTYPLLFQVNLTEVKRWHKGGLILK